jgi:hypothetical protein
MRLVALLASAILLIASSASATIFDPHASFIELRLAGLGGDPAAINGNVGTEGLVSLTGTPGAEVLNLGGSFGDVWDTDNREVGTQFLTGTPTIENLFFTIQNGTGTFTWGTAGSFQGKPLCATPCFQGNDGDIGLHGQVLVEVAGPIFAGIPVEAIGAGAGTGMGGVGAVTIKIETGRWLTGTASITNIATNIITITNTINGRAGVTGIGFTLLATVNENSDLQAENGVTVVTVAGTTSFETLNGTSGVNQVTLVTPVHIDAGMVTGEPAQPGMALKVFRFVPEPGTMLLLGSAVAGLLVVGRKRMKR